jgi:hypothetical protein
VYQTLAVSRKELGTDAFGRLEPRSAQGAGLTAGAANGRKRSIPLWLVSLPAEDNEDDSGDGQCRHGGDQVFHALLCGPPGSEKTTDGHRSL